MSTIAVLQIDNPFDFNCDDHAKMLVHGTYLIRDSEFFAAALKKEWVEGQTRTVKLYDECPKTMAHYMTYVYSRNLPTIEITSTSRMGQEEFSTCYLLLSSLYVLGERFLNQAIKNAAIREFFRLTRVRGFGDAIYNPSGEAVNVIYRGTPESSPARRFMVDCHLSHGQESWLDSMSESAFLLDLAKGFSQQRGSAKQAMKPEDYVQ